jgi:hypothetical protein
MFRIDDWVLYDQFPDSVSDSLKKPKKAVILEVLGEKEYIIWVDDPSIDVEWRRRKVNEENLKPLD